MLQFPKQLYLASKSPRRAELLSGIGLDFKIKFADIDENAFCNPEPSFFVKALSMKKAETVQEMIEYGIIISADTIVVAGNEILGKPKDEKDAFEMLKMLSGIAHFVYTGFTLMDSPSTLCVTDYAVTEVRFKKLSDFEINEYIKTGSPFDKAGAYGIQDGICALFVEEIKGCYYNVMGFPLNKFYTTSLQFIEELKKI